MRKTQLVLLSTSVALICTLVSIEISTSVVTAKAYAPRPLAVEVDSSMVLSPVQDAPFIWVYPNDEKDYPAYQRVEGGQHQDGTMMYICQLRNYHGTIQPGKLYKRSCYYSYGGLEKSYPVYQVLLTNSGYQWKDSAKVPRAQIEEGRVVKGGLDQGSDPIYVCRKQMSDGLHPGKYSYNNNLCYIPWGGKEYSYKEGFEFLYRGAPKK